jgi:citrate synthase
MEADKTGAVASGLEGVLVAETRLSEVDGERGRLILAGHEIEELALASTFEDALFLLFKGALPTPAQRDEVRQLLGAARVKAHAKLGQIGDALINVDGMDALRAGVAHFREADGDALAAAAELAGATAVVAAAWSRTQTGGSPIAPDSSLSHAADYLRLVRGAPADAARVEALDAYLVTVADHGMNASTFASRVVASTGSDLVSAVVAGIGALKGPLHGGAPGPVLDMLDKIGDPAKAEAWIEGELAAKRRIMGMGHRIYRVRDPRAAVLERAATRLEAKGVTTPNLALARAVERAADGVLSRRYPDRPLRANVEFYTAVVLDAVGLPRALFSPTFAVSRVAGWCAHVAEQRATGRLIRPASRYIGPMPASAPAVNGAVVEATA